MPDRDDEPFLEVARAGHPEAPVTGNAVHFPVEAGAGMAVLTPPELVEDLRAHGEV